MKIKETIERECCQNTDLLPYKGEIPFGNIKYSFCKYCGQIWFVTRVMSAAGSMEDELTKYVIK